MNNTIENITDKATLEYLTNPNYNILNKTTDSFTSQEELDQFKLDKRFYKKRIISLTRDMFKKNDYPANLNDVHNQYVRYIINHFKLIDRKDILQSEYDNIELSKTYEGDISYNIDEANKEIYNIKEPVPSLDNYVKITKVNSERKILPKKKDINLKHPQLKTKGLREKKNKNTNKI